MIALAVDAVTALVILTDRALSAAEKNVRCFRASPRPVEATHRSPGPAFPSAAGPGGHPRDTSELLSTAASFVRSYRQSITRDGCGPYLLSLDELVSELSDRAAQLAAVGD